MLTGSKPAILALALVVLVVLVDFSTFRTVCNPKSKLEGLSRSGGSCHPSFGLMLRPDGRWSYRIISEQSDNLHSLRNGTAYCLLKTTCLCIKTWLTSLIAPLCASYYLAATYNYSYGSILDNKGPDRHTHQGRMQDGVGRDDRPLMHGLGLLPAHIDAIPEGKDATTHICIEEAFPSVYPPYEYKYVQVCTSHVCAIQKQCAGIQPRLYSYLVGESMYLYEMVNQMSVDCDAAQPGGRWPVVACAEIN